MKESKFQTKLIRKIRERFPGCLIMKNDPNYIDGIPDLTVLFEDKWAFLEVKRSQKARRQSAETPTGKLQTHYIDWAQSRSFGSFIYPENEEEVLNELERSFRTHR